MAKCVVHMQKFKVGGIRGIQNHNERITKSKTNPDIIPERTPDNYELTALKGNSEPSEGKQKTYYQKIKDRIKELELKKAVRKDAVVYCSFVVTSDQQTIKKMTPEQQREFFQDSVDFFAEKYGKKNIVNATVHMDETTPHMHLGLVPATADNRLSAKELFTPETLTQLQTEFAEKVGQKHGLERGLNGSKAKHKKEIDYKIKKQSDLLLATTGYLNKTREVIDKLLLQAKHKGLQELAIKHEAYREKALKYIEKTGQMLEFRKYFTNSMAVEQRERIKGKSQPIRGGSRGLDGIEH